MKIKTGNIGKFSTGMFSSVKLLYSGMPTAQTFAICPVVETSSLHGESSFAPVVYYSVESEIIWILGEKFKVTVIDVNFIEINLIKA